MSFSIVDRRANGKGKSVGNRQKFLERVRESVKKSLPDIINSRKIQDMDSSGGIVHIPQKGIGEPSFRHGEGGQREVVRPGNKEFNTGDRFRKPPPQDPAAGKKGSENGEGEDDFLIEISREEFLDYFFEDLELPDLIKQGLKEVTQVKYHNAGFTSTGSPAKLDVARSLRTSHGRRIASKSPYKRKLKEAEAELFELRLKEVQAVARSAEEQAEIVARIAELEKKIEGYKRKIANVPFLDPLDLKYHTVVAEEIAVTSAVMICVMDNSGSMGEHEKTLARKFFSLLYMFLVRKYEKVTVRFVSHTTHAREVEEEEFFNTRENGGTIISTALDLLKTIIENDYGDGNTNIYVCQCSDGDNWTSDNNVCRALLDEILPQVQYFGYIQVGEHRGYNSDIWSTYQKVADDHSNFQMKCVYDDGDIYPVFQQLFEKKK